MRLDSNVISLVNLMKLIMRFGVGLEGDVATKCAIKAARIPSDVSGNAASCAELSIYLMMGLLRKQIGLFNLIPDSHSSFLNEMRMAIEQKKLRVPTGETLLGKTVFISGFGNIEVELAKRLRPFGVKIIAAKRIWASHSQVCCQSSGSLLVNIVRGGLLDYEAVAHYLESGHLGGLGLDVAWTEPFDPNDPILKFQSVLITPHVGGVTEHSYRSTAKVVGDVALQLHAGTPLTGIEPVN
ncbi:D-isomer specific 2-hydroxyacid dehydrogenase family protein [Citrus sinensis]|uniref:D-isomer specific 2-hydroxyacid dehydrogenase family protein n=1 Tax=Citrus sinensis TaxID=2711 RepID=A0ACB8M6D2_CITSI|nr:D-isomer specific 2-hydroxyacid dehydrogenase family protein [Citrus sinensis]